MAVDDQEDFPVGVLTDQPVEEVDEHELVELATEQREAQRPVVPIAEIMFTPNRWPVASLTGVTPLGEHERPCEGSPSETPSRPAQARSRPPLGLGADLRVAHLEHSSTATGSRSSALRAGTCGVNPKHADTGPTVVTASHPEPLIDQLHHRIARPQEPRQLRLIGIVLFQQTNNHPLLPRQQRQLLPRPSTPAALLRAPRSHHRANDAPTSTPPPAPAPKSSATLR